MKDIIIETLFGKISLTLSELDPEGKRVGCIDWSELSDGNDPETPDIEIDTLERLILAHACAGVDVESEAYIEGINTVLEAIDNNS